MLTAHSVDLFESRGWSLLPFALVVVGFIFSSVGQAKVFVAHNIQCYPDSADSTDPRSRLAIAVEHGDTYGKVTVGTADGDTLTQASKLLGSGVPDYSTQPTATGDDSPGEEPDLLGLTLAVEAAEGNGLNVRGLEFAVNSKEKDRTEYLVYSFADGCSRVDVLTAESVNASGEQGGLKRFCRLDLESLAFKDTKRVEFRIYPVGGASPEGLTFDEIAVDGFVTQAPMPPTFAIWGGVFLIAFLAGYTFFFLLWLSSARAVAETNEIASMSVPLDDGRATRRYGGNWSNETRQAILGVLNLPPRG